MFQLLGSWSQGNSVQFISILNCLALFFICRRFLVASFSQLSQVLFLCLSRSPSSLLFCLPLLHHPPRTSIIVSVFSVFSTALSLLLISVCLYIPSSSSPPSPPPHIHRPSPFHPPTSFILNNHQYLIDWFHSFYQPPQQKPATWKLFIFVVSYCTPYLSKPKAIRVFN